MSLGRKKQERQQQFWVEMDSLPDVPRHVFYDKLNELLDSGDFDRWIEQICEPYYAEKAGRPGIPPGVYFRMLSATSKESTRSVASPGGVPTAARCPRFSGSTSTSEPPIIQVSPASACGFRSRFTKRSSPSC